jgi:hypothetical protein
MLVTVDIFKCKIVHMHENRCVTMYYNYMKKKRKEKKNILEGRQQELLEIPIPQMHSGQIGHFC